MRSGAGSLTGPDRQRQWGLDFALLSAGEAAQRDYLAERVRRDPRAAVVTAARLYRVDRAVDPDRWDAPPRRRTLLVSLERGALDRLGKEP